MKLPTTAMALALGVSLFAAAAARGQEEDEGSPLGPVIIDMQVAGGRLGKLLTDKPTQTKQKDAVEKLEALIKLLEERRRRQQGSQVGPNPDQPAEDSTIRMGPGGSGPLHDANRNGRSWGQLPAHKREQILQSMTEGFPSHYQQLLERYYRRLAEEKPANELADEAGPAPAGKPPQAGSAPEAGKPAAAMEKRPAAGTAKP